MKRNLSVCTIAAAAFALCLALAGCGGSPGTSASSEAQASSSAASASTSGEAAKTASEGGFAGTWMISAMDDLEEDGLASMIDSGYGMFFVLEEDGTASYEFLGFAENGTYQPESDTEATLSLEDEDNWKDKLYLEDGMLKVESVDGGFAYFTRITEAEHREYNATYDYDPGSYSSENAAADADEDSSAASSKQAESIEVNKVIADDDLCTIKVLDAFDNDGVIGYNVELTNKSDRTLTFMSGGRSGSNTIDGKEVSFIFYEEVEAGQTAKSEFDYWESDVEGGAEKLVNVKGVINVNDMSISDTIASYDFEL